jgi:hypothetical protein
LVLCDSFLEAVRLAGMMSFLSFDDAYREKMVLVLETHVAELESVRAAVESAARTGAPISNLHEFFRKVQNASADLLTVCKYCETQGFSPDLTRLIGGTVERVGECSAALLAFAAALLSVEIK